MSLLRLKAEVGEEAANSVIHKIQGVFFFFFFFLHNALLLHAGMS